jgi:1-deoxy-D-xylulose-5-phosphate reductoisomerase
MGSKITIDSATMMNKGLEVIEAYWLFNISINNIDIVIHPQSIIHSMVEFIDGSIKAQLGHPSMTIPIHYALNYPNRTTNNTTRFNFLNSPNLTFEKPDLNKFKCIKLAYQALNYGDSYPIVLNVANDLCVEAFLNDKIKFIEIASYIEDALEAHNSFNINDIESIFDVINNTQKYIEKKIGNK